MVPTKFENTLPLARHLHNIQESNVTLKGGGNSHIYGTTLDLIIDLIDTNVSGTSQCVEETYEDDGTERRSKPVRDDAINKELIMILLNFFQFLLDLCQGIMVTRRNM